MPTAVAQIPEQGQLVSVRSRQWVVTEVAPSTLPSDRLQASIQNPQNLLTLSSVEDDGLGEPRPGGAPWDRGQQAPRVGMRRLAEDDLVTIPLQTPAQARRPGAPWSRPPAFSPSL